MELAPPLSAPATPPAPADDARCLQCGTARVGAFCHACGQHASVGDRLTFRSLWRDFRKRRLNLDRGLLRTLVDVVLRPGVVARAFVEGRRQTYTHPITLLFVVYAVYAIVYGVLEDGFRQMMETQMQSQLSGLPDGGGPDVEMIHTVMGETMRVVFTYGSYFSLMMILPFAAMLRWLLADRGRTMAECAVLGAYVEAAVVIPSALVFVPLSVALQMPTVSSLGLVLYLGYAAWGAAQFFDRRPSTMALAVLSVIVALVVYLAVFMVGAFGGGIYAGVTSTHAG